MPNTRYDLAKIEDTCQLLTIYLEKVITENGQLVTQPCDNKIVISGNYQFAVLQEVTASFLGFPNLSEFINPIEFEKWDFFKIKDLAKDYHWQQYVIGFEHTMIVVLSDISPKFFTNEKTTWENQVNSVFDYLETTATQDNQISVEKLPLEEREPLNFDHDLKDLSENAKRILNFAGSWYDLDKEILSPKSIQKRRLQSIRKS